MGHTTLALFLAAAILVALFEDADRERSRGPIQRDCFRLASAVQLAAVIVLGPWSGALVAKVKNLASAPSVGTDQAGNVYVVWNPSKDANGTIGGSLAFASSKNRGKTWSRPTTITSLATGAPGAMFWPWAAGGAAGHLAVAWYQSNKVTNVDQHGSVISVYAAQILDATAAKPHVDVVNATGVVHRGIVCQSGTTCVATGQDRRLGDYLTCVVDMSGRLLIAYANTTVDPKSPVARPALVIQNSGPRV